MSLSGERAAEERRRSAITLEGSTLRLGQSSWAFTTGLDLEANNNIRFAPNQEQADLIVRPQVQTRMVWPVSENNSLTLAIDTGYSLYATHSEFSRLFIGPASQFSFDLYAGDLWINMHERVSITEDAYNDPTVVGTADYSQFQNTAGLSATWDLNKVLVTFGYDRTDYRTITGGSAFPDGASDVFALSAGYQANSTLNVGIQTGGGLIEYDTREEGLTTAVDWNAGAFLETQPTEYMRIRAVAGYTVYSPQAAAGQSDFTGVYGQLSVNHRINRYLDYDLSGGRSVSFGFYAGTIDLYNAVLEARWHFFQKLSLSTGFVFEHGTQVLIGQESFDRIGPRLSLERSISAKLSGMLRYQFYKRQSNTVGGDYDVNLVTVSLVYRM